MLKKSATLVYLSDGLSLLLAELRGGLHEDDAGEEAQENLLDSQWNLSRERYLVSPSSLSLSFSLCLSVSLLLGGLHEDVAGEEAQENLLDSQWNLSRERYFISLFLYLSVFLSLSLCFPSLRSAARRRCGRRSPGKSS